MRWTVRWFADRGITPTKVGAMNRLFVVAAAALIVAGVTPVCAQGAQGASPPQSRPHATQPPQHAAGKPRVYGAPIQPPIVKKVVGKRSHAPKAGSTSTTAKRKANAVAARKAKVDLQYRREHPASADGPH